MASFRSVRGGILAALALLMSCQFASAQQLNPAAVTYIPLDKIQWKRSPAGGNESAVLVGDPTKEGLYVMVNKWLKGNHFSAPHFHPNDRFITVIKGTWWVGTGNKLDPDKSVPMPAGTVVTHYGKQVHWDGAKDEDAVLLIVGMGPATSTRVEQPK